MVRERGFTLIELMIVLFVVGVVVSFIVGGASIRKEQEFLDATIKHGRDLVAIAETVRNMAKTTTTTNAVPTGVFSHTRPVLPADSTVQAMLNLFPGTPPKVLDKTPWGTSYTVEITSNLSKVSVLVPMTDIDIEGATVTTVGTQSKITFYPRWSIEDRNSHNARSRFVRNFMTETSN